jgi:hypothetical protein
MHARCQTEKQIGQESQFSRAEIFMKLMSLQREHVTGLQASDAGTSLPFHSRTAGIRTAARMEAISGFGLSNICLFHNELAMPNLVQQLRTYLRRGQGNCRYGMHDVSSTN